ncbi:MAG: phosphatidate cytidylyltransferase [Desulfobacterales bacterium]|nr:phosphatidate cytidylyltransferase [Desulfobacterales bacterium]
MMSAHVKRWLTAVVGLPVLALLIVAGEIYYALLVGLVSAVGLLEYYALVLPGQPVVAKVGGLILGLAVMAPFYTMDAVAASGMLVLAFLGAALVCLAQFGPGTSAAEVLSKQVMGFFYVPFLFGHLILVRGGNQGMVWTFFLMAVVFAGDTGAYYIGKALGSHKLAPNISPGKTVEGAAGGLVSNLLIGLLFKKYWLPEVSWGSCAALIVFMGVLSQIGDLVESMLKRSVGIKDSGIFLPGHGGMLDRIDGLLFAAPALYYFKTCFL